MIRIGLGMFLVLHGLVHLLYFGQSARYFELQPGMAWPDGSWALVKVLGSAGTRSTASVLLILAAVGFVAGGAGAFFTQPWWRTVAAGAAVFSSLVYLVFWDGGLQNLDNQGMVGVLINLVLIAALLLLR